jgi:hypothetical protein
MIKECQAGDIDGSLARIGALWDKGYSAVDIVTTVFRVVKGMEELPEYTKLEFIRVSHKTIGEVLRIGLICRKSDGRICEYWKV